MKNVVPVLITCDMDPLTMDERIRYGLPLKDAQSSLLKASIEMMLDMLSDMRINATFFITASLAEEIADELKEIKNRRHQIGCHGLTHGDDGNFMKSTTLKCL